MAERIETVENAVDLKNDSSQIIIEEIILKEEDIPGAKLPRDTPEECKVQQLQRWLLCRGAKVTGKKEVLVQR